MPYRSSDGITRFQRRSPRDALRLLTAAEGGDIASLSNSPSTVHTSTVDSTGAACSVTVSAGYGSGVIPPGTGIWMNNCLGEIELNRRGFHALAPGHETHTSNMAPTIARHEDGRVLSVGSPGAARITTAILETVLNFTELGMSLAEPSSNPASMWNSTRTAEWQVAYEGSSTHRQLGYPLRRFETIDMFFGGVGAAYWDSHGVRGPPPTLAAPVGSPWQDLASRRHRRSSPGRSLLTGEVR